VVGTFGTRISAVRFGNKISQPDLRARDVMNTSTNVYYVYLFKSKDREQASAYLTRVKAETDYKDAWIFHSGPGGQSVVTSPPQKPAPPPAEPPKVVKNEEVLVKEEPTKVVEKPAETAVAPKSDPVVPRPPGKPFFFKLVSEQTGAALVGEIQVSESAKASEFLAYESNQLVYVPAPKNKQGTFQVKTLSPGYKSLKRSISYTDPANSAAATGPSGEFVIALPLVGVKAGDYIEFSNVRFFANSAILQPESKVELGSLVKLMNENQSYHVVIHGHCNGEEIREISSPAASADLFTTGPSNVRETADAKKLTLLRAETVKAYLVTEGIDASRIKTKGDGGKDVIYPKNSTLSARNDRVEVEVKKGK